MSYRVVIVCHALNVRPRVTYRPVGGRVPPPQALLAGLRVRLPAADGGGALVGRRARRAAGANTTTHVIPRHVIARPRDEGWAADGGQGALVGRRARRVLQVPLIPHASYHGICHPKDLGGAPWSAAARGAGCRWQHTTSCRIITRRRFLGRGDLSRCQRGCVACASGVSCV